jgi:hypothetical protein
MGRVCGSCCLSKTDDMDGLASKKRMQDSQISTTTTTNTTDIVSHQFDVNIDQFKMHKVIGKGAFGMVYLA